MKEEQTNEGQMATLKKGWIAPDLEIISRNNIESGSAGAPESLDASHGFPLSDFQGVAS